MESKEIIIATNEIDNEEEWRERYEEYLEINDLDERDCPIEEYTSDTLEEYLRDEMTNLDVDCGDIIAIADLGFWNGRMSGYQVIKKGKLNGIFDLIGNSILNYKFYCDEKDVRAVLKHHDGTHFVLIREIKEGADIEQLTSRLHNWEDVPIGLVAKLTKSLRPLVKKVYGFK